MQITILIPTYNRIQKLKRLIDSIQIQKFKDWSLYIIADNNDIKTYSWVKKNYSNKIHSILNKKQDYVIGCINLFLKNNFNNVEDLFLFLCDDIELYPNCLEKLNEFYEKSFPEKDGVVGISQEVPGHPEATPSKYGQCVVGKNFINKYPDNQVCCPDYIFWYQDEEMSKYATSIGKFKYYEKALLKHYHPCRIKSELDETHKVSRGTVKQKDDETYRKRQELGLIWGKSWERVNE